MTDPLDELFQVVPQEFVALRDRIARQLRQAGDRAASARVKALRRPTASVWALNQLARRQPDEVAELLEAGADLPAAQDALLAGDQERFRTALAHHRDLVSRLAGLGVRLVEDAEVSATDQRQELTADLQAASTIPEAAEPFRSGRLEDRPGALGEPVTGLPGGGLVVPFEPSASRGKTAGGPKRRALSVVPDRPEEDAPAPATPPPEDPREAAERRRKRARADARVAAAESALSTTRQEQERTAKDVEDLEADLARARERLDEVSERREALEDELSEAREARQALD